MVFIPMGIGGKAPILILSIILILATLMVTDSLMFYFGLPQDGIVILYSGSMSRKQGLEILPEVVRQFQARKDVCFVFCGEGPAREDLEKGLAGAEEPESQEEGCETNQAVRAEAVHE